METSNIQTLGCFVVNITDHNTETGTNMTITDAAFFDFDSAVKYAKSRFYEEIEHGVCGRRECCECRVADMEHGYFKAESMCLDKVTVEVDQTIIFGGVPERFHMPVITW